MDLKELFVREKLSAGDPYRLWAQDQYLTTLKIVTGLIVLVHPSFHFILNAFNLNVPDSLLNRLVTALCSVILLAIADRTSWGRRNTAFIFGTSMLIKCINVFVGTVIGESSYLYFCVVNCSDGRKSGLFNGT